MPHITHCIFDMDGLLLDTERVYTEATQQILDKYLDNGAKFTWDIKSQVMGRSSHDSANIVINHYNLPLATDVYLNEVAAIQNELFPHAKLLPGVEKFIRHLHAHNIPIAVATSSTREKFELKTMLNKPVFNLFNVIICGDDAEIKHAKPAPDLFLAAQRHLGNPPSENCMVFEDAVSGIQAALAAKMNVVWIPDDNIKALSGDSDQGATIVLNSMADFIPEAFGLPAY